MKRVILFGATSFVGEAVLRELYQKQVEIVAVAHSLSSPKAQSLQTQYPTVQWLSCALDQVSQLSEELEPGFDVWYQFAWAGISGSELTNSKTQISNIQWLVDSVQTAAKLSCQKFVGAGTISQMELSYTPICTGADRYRIYKAAKQACASIGQSVALECGIEFIWPIITNIYGAGEISSRFINTMIRNLHQNCSMPLTPGEQMYDFIYITDAAHAFCLIGEFGRAYRSYVIGSGAAKPLREFLIELRDTIAPSLPLRFGETPYHGVFLDKKVFSIQELQEDTGFSPVISFADGISQTSEWLKQQTVI